MFYHQYRRGIWKMGNEEDHLLFDAENGVFRVESILPHSAHEGTLRGSARDTAPATGRCIACMRRQSDYCLHIPYERNEIRRLAITRWGQDRYRWNRSRSSCDT